MSTIQLICVRILVPGVLGCQWLRRLTDGFERDRQRRDLDVDLRQGRRRCRRKSRGLILPIAITHTTLDAFVLLSRLSDISHHLSSSLIWFTSVLIF